MKGLKYLAALSIPLATAIAIYLKGVFSYAAIFYAFVLIPILEMLLKQDSSNDSKEMVARKKISVLYDWLLYINLPIVYGLLVWGLAVVSQQNLALYEIIGLGLSLGVCLGTNGINVAHELGHRKKKAEKFMAKTLLLPSLYMHFFIEHNWGHHRYAATKEDPATAAYKQSVFSFWISSVTRQYINAWKLQTQINNEEERPFYSLKNDMFWYLCIQFAYLAGIWLLFGDKVLVFAICAAMVGFLLLETVNYIEHYGLLRAKNKAGRYEAVRAKHSWNSNHIIGRLVLYELTRHSDHHYKAAKKYQTLACHEDAPQMPFGYPTSMVISFLPPLWFRLMNKRVPKEMKELATGN